jgi:hypothetical protein
MTPTPDLPHAAQQHLNMISDKTLERITAADSEVAIGLITLSSNVPSQTIAFVTQGLNGDFQVGRFPQTGRPVT